MVWLYHLRSNGTDVLDGSHLELPAPVTRRKDAAPMTTVETVLGQVDSADLGTTLMHEHVFVLTADVQLNEWDGWDEEGRVAEAVKKLTELKAVGVDTIIDPTVIGLGRYLPRIQRINELVDINIVPATGIYTYDDVPFYFYYR